MRPNYNWHLRPEDLSRNIFYCRPIYLGYRSKKSYESLVKLRRRQIHLFGFIHWGFIYDYGFSFQELFQELFSPSAKILYYVDRQREIHKFWDGIVFRFQDLLGDFNEDKSVRYRKIDFSYTEKQRIIGRCLNYVIDYKKKVNKSVLVCSDSIMFLKEAEKIPGVFINPGELSHMQYDTQNNDKSQEKAFTDLLMLSESDRVLSVGTNVMYPSDFPRIAAMINNKPFERVML